MVSNQGLLELATVKVQNDLMGVAVLADGLLIEMELLQSLALGCSSPLQLNRWGTIQHCKETVYTEVMH